MIGDEFQSFLPFSPYDFPLTFILSRRGARIGCQRIVLEPVAALLNEFAVVVPLHINNLAHLVKP